MKNLQEYVKKNATDTRLVEEMDSLNANLIGDENSYVNYFGKSKSFLESLSKFNYLLTGCLNYLENKGTIVNGAILVVKDVENENHNIRGVIEKLEYFSRITFYHHQQISVTIDTTLTNGSLKIATVLNDGYEGDVYVEGFAPCMYKISGNDTEYVGTLWFTGDTIYLYPSKEFTESTVYLSIYFGGNPLIFKN
jgi:hypothetical protein